MLKLHQIASWLLPLATLPGWAMAQPAPLFALVCRGTITSGSEAKHARTSAPWSSRIVVDLKRKTWRQDGGDAKPLLDWSEDGASLTVMAAGGHGFASSIRWVKGDAYYVGLGDPSLTLIKADCTAEDAAGRPLPLPSAR